MSLNNVTWVLIRIAGMYFVYLGVMSLINLIGTLGSIGAPRGGGGVLGAAAFNLFFDLALGVYLIVDGSHVHRVLNNYPESTDK